MALKLPKQFHPDFSRPGVKPTVAIEIDWSNPLARGLKVCMIGNSQRATNLANQANPLTINGNVTHNARDGYVFGDTLSDYISDASTDYAQTGKFSAFLVVKAEYSSGNLPTFIARGDAAAGEWMFRHNNSGAVRFYANGGTWNTTSANLLSYGIKQTVGFSADTGAGLSVYVNGAVADTAGGSFSNTSTKPLTIGAADGDSNRPYAGSMNFILVYDRLLSSQEHAELNRDPYQILKPAQPMMLFTSAGGGGGGPSTQTLLVSSIVTGEAFGQPGVSFSALSIAMSAIASGEAVGQVTIDTSRSVGLSAIPSLEAFGLYSVTTGAVTVSTLGIASGEASGLISVASGTYVNPVGVASGEALGQVSVQTLSVDILPVGIGSLEAFGLPEVPREAVTITVQPANYGEVMGEPLILVGDVTVAVNSASAGESMGQPEVRLAQMYIRPEGIYSGMMFGRIAIVGGDFVYVASDYAVISPVVKSVVESVVTGLAA